MVHPYQHVGETYNLLWAHTEQKVSRRAISFFLSWDICLLLPSDLVLVVLKFIGLGLNYTTGFPDSLAGTEKIVKLLTFHNQFL